MSNIRLSKKHGVNPAIPLCFFCNKPKNELILVGQMKNKDEKGSVIDEDAEAPKNMVWDRHPCEECSSLMEQGVLFISVDAKKSADPNNPWRTGGWCVVKDDAVRRMVQPPDLVEQILKRRAAFLPDEVWDALGLPRGEVPR